MAKDRYFYTPEIIDEIGGFRKLRSTIYPTIDQKDDDIIIVTNVGDRLDTLAYRYYGDVTMWWIIAQANHMGKGSFNVPAGTKLRIPKDFESIMEDLEIVNQSR